MTADNAELFLWPIDLKREHVTLSNGYLVTVNIAGYKISDPRLGLRSPLDLHMRIGVPSRDTVVLTAIYKTVLRSFRSPGECSTADQVRVAVEWFAKAWLNIPAVQRRERLGYCFRSVDRHEHQLEECPQTPQDLRGVATHNKGRLRYLGVVSRGAARSHSNLVR